MDEIKEELDEDYLSCANSCFLCLEAIPLNINNSEELINSTNLFFKYLKIRDEIQAFVCANCGENLTKFVKLCSALEKVRLEIDYLLDLIKNAILDSNSFKPVYSGLVAARQLILGKCLEDVINPKPDIEVETYSFKTESPIPTSDCSNDYLPNCDSDNNSNLNSIPASDCSYVRTSRDDDKELTIATPVITDKTAAKSRVNSKRSVKSKPKRSRVLPEKCLKCSKTFTTKGYLKKHNDRVHLGLKPSPDSSHCPKCARIFTTKPQLTRHINTVHLKIKPYKCDLCDLAFRDSREVTRHKESVHLRLKPFKCPTCSKPFSNKSLLKRHINDVHLHIKPFMCDVCGRSFQSAYALNLHKTIPHGPQQQTQLTLKFSCEKCEKKFGSVRVLNNHMRSAHLEGRFKCKICTKSFIAPVNLRKHISAVHDKQRHFCKEPGCNKSFSEEATLNGHYRLKHPNSPFTPKPQPPRIVKYSERVENGEIVFDCNLCTNKFKTFESVRYHIKSIHDEKTFLCADCGFAAPYQSRLKKHIERMHKVDKSGECQE